MQDRLSILWTLLPALSPGHRIGFSSRGRRPARGGGQLLVARTAGRWRESSSAAAGGLRFAGHLGNWIHLRPRPLDPRHSTNTMKGRAAGVRQATKASSFRRVDGSSTFSGIAPSCGCGPGVPAWYTRPGPNCSRAAWICITGTCGDHGRLGWVKTGAIPRGCVRAVPRTNSAPARRPLQASEDGPLKLPSPRRAAPAPPRAGEENDPTETCWLELAGAGAAGAGTDLPARIPLNAPCICIGRGEQAVDVQLDSRRYPNMLSRRHARLEINHGTARLCDLGGENGTWVNASRVRADRALADGDLVVFGQALPPHVSEVRYTFHSGRLGKS